MTWPTLHSGPDTTRVAIVGNAPDPTDLSHIIDGADHVVRFNNAYGFGGVTGSRVDDLFLVNCGGQALEWLRDAAFWRAPCLRQTRHVTLPWQAREPRALLSGGEDGPGANVDGLNFEWDMRARLMREGIAVTTLDPASVAAARADLGTDAPPSTGFLAIHHYWQRLAGQKGAEIHLYGFGFDGWDGHAWDRERRWVADRRDEITLHAPALP